MGFAHTLPQTNLYTHGTLVTAMHGHYAFWGAYAMIGLAIISYALPNLTGRKRYNSVQGNAAFWLSNIGILGMTVAFGVAGVVQVYLERKQKMEFMEVQKEIEIVRKEIAQASNKTLLLMGTFGIFFLGVLAKGFHWF